MPHAPIDIQQLLDEVSETRLMEYNRRIASEVRLSGSPEELRCFKYLQKLLSSFGLATRLTFSDAYISLPLASSLELEGRLFDCVTASMASPTPPGGLTAELLLAGNLEGLAKLGDAAKGKAVLLYGFTSRPAVSLAAKLGAAACIFVNGERLHSMIASPVWGNPTPETVHLIPDIVVLSVDKHAGKHLAEAAKRGKQVWLEAAIDRGWRAIPTLIAERRGTIEPDKFVLFSGHVDSWGYGAMDNGSANAAMAEVGRLLAKAPLRRTLRLAFWSGHSHGRYAGSAHYMDEHFEEIRQNCLLHVNIDSVGAVGASVITEGNIMALTKPLAVEVIRELTGETFTGRPIGRGGDHSFWGAGVASAFMSFSGQPYRIDPDDLDTQYMISQFHNGPKGAGFGWWWHSAEDTLDKIDPQNLARDTRCYLMFLWRCLNDPIVPLDLEAGVGELREGLERYKADTRGLFSLEPTCRALDELEGVAHRLRYESVDIASPEQTGAFNAAAQAIAQTVVRLGYVGISEFDHDPALNFSYLPLLGAATQLSGAPEHRDADLMLCTELRRRQNQCVSILQEGTRRACDFLNGLSTPAKQLEVFH